MCWNEAKSPTRVSGQARLETCFGLLTGLYEKVINVKADVAAVLVSATKRREWR